MRFHLLFTFTDPWKQTHNIWLIHGKSRKQFETPATSGFTRQYSSRVERASWLLLIPFWLEVYYIFLRTSHCTSLSSSSPIPQQRIMDSQTPQPGESGSELSETMDASSNLSLDGTQHQCRHQLVHCHAANAATANITQDSHLKTIRKTRRSRNKQQHATGCEYIHIEADGPQLTLQHTVGIHWELCEQYIAVRHGKPTWSTKIFVHTVCETEHHDVVSSGILPDQFHDNHPREWMNQALTTSEDATEAYKVEVKVKSYFLEATNFL